MILIIFLYAILASTFIFAKLALLYAKPFFLIGIRSILSGSILLFFQFLYNKKRLIIKRSDWWLFLEAALFQVYLAYIPAFWSLQYLSALKTTIIYSATPFVTAVLAFFILKKNLNKTQILGITVGVSGLLPILLAQTGSSLEQSMELYRISLPEIVLFVAVFSGAYAWFKVSALMKRGYSFFVINGITMFLGGIMSMFTSILVEDITSPVSSWPHFLFWLTLLIVFTNLIFYNLYAWLLKRYSITFLSFCGFLSPGFATIYDWLFMSGELGWETILSLILITGGLSIFYKSLSGN